MKADCIRVTHPCAGRQRILLSLLPLDLHVLGLPLAFILSQDQTLRILCLSRDKQMHTGICSGRSYSCSPSGEHACTLIAVLSYHDSVVKVLNASGHKKPASTDTSPACLLQTCRFYACCCPPELLQSLRFHACLLCCAQYYTHHRFT